MKLWFEKSLHVYNSTLKEILAALDDKLNNADLDGMIAEIDSDGSGTVDFDGNSLKGSYIIQNVLMCVCLFILEFMEMMTGD